MSGLTAGITAFREAYMNAGALDTPDFNEFEARKLRYAIFWAFFQNTAYRDINKWAPSLRAEYGLYKFARNIYNPAYRLGKFWQAHLMGGALDPNAGDGKTAPSALPILTEVDALRRRLRRCGATRIGRFAKIFLRCKVRCSATLVCA